MGAGKSRALCIAAIIHVAGRPEARCGLFRKTLVGLKKSTLKTLLEGDGKAPAVLPPGTYTHNKNDAEIRINGGGSILYSGVETPESVRSMNLSMAVVDEVTEMTADDYSAVDDRVRMDLGEPMRVLSATNPGTPSHWMARMLGLAPDKQEPDADCRVILTRTADNTYLPAAYIKSFARHEGTVYYRRMFLGEWCGSDGLVFDQFRRDLNIRETEHEPKRRVLGVDDGTSDPFVVLDCHLDTDRRVHVAREVYKTGLDLYDKIAAVKAWADRDTVVVVEAASPDLVATLRREGLSAVPCEKGQGSIEYGINLIQADLKPNGDGLPRLTVSPDCMNTVREFESYQWAEGRHGLKDVPVDKDNHAMDALRYVRRYLDTGTPAVGVLTTGQDAWDNEAMWSEA